jgi:ADP-heptose:LPS heptosyltransferase
MQLNEKVAIDRLFGSIAMGLLTCFRSKNQRSSFIKGLNPKNIVIIKLLGMGSIVQATPLMSALKLRFPEVKLIFVTSKSNLQLTRRISLIDQSRSIDDSNIWTLVLSLASGIRQLRGWRDTCIINLEAFSKLGTLIILTSKAQWKASFYQDDRDLRIAHALDYLVYYNQAAPLSEIYLQIGRAVGIGPVSPGLFEMNINKDDKREVDNLLREHGINESTKTLVLVNPNVSELIPERKWPINRFSSLIEKLIDEIPSIHVLLIGSPAEKDYVEDLFRSIKTNCRERVSNVAGKIRFGGLLELIKRSKLLVTNDSGPMHFAFAVGTRTVAFFGPVSPEQRLCKTKEQSVFLYHRMYCSPCVHNFNEAPCKGDNICMQHISVEEAYEAACKLLYDKQTTPIDVNITYSDKGKPLGAFGYDM